MGCRHNILQENKIVLKGLLCSLLHLQSENIDSVEITNPIILGEAIDEKDFILDVRVLMNDNTIIDLEMQMENRQNWTDRSLSYLCRNFTQLYHGQDYTEAKPVYQIGFLNYTLFPNEPEFYAKYQMLNIASFSIYSDKLNIGVVNLKRADLATEEDKFYRLDKWVALFKSKTWEELQMIAKESPDLMTASESIYKYNSEEVIRDRCFAREQYNKIMRTYERDFNQLNEAIEEKNLLLTQMNDSIAKKDASIAEKDASIAEKDASIAEKDASIAEMKEIIKQLQDQLSKLTNK